MRSEELLHWLTAILSLIVSYFAKVHDLSHV